MTQDNSIKRLIYPTQFDAVPVVQFRQQLHASALRAQVTPFSILIHFRSLLPEMLEGDLDIPFLVLKAGNDATLQGCSCSLIDRLAATITRTMCLKVGSRRVSLKVEQKNTNSAVTTNRHDRATRTQIRRAGSRQRFKSDYFLTNVWFYRKGFPDMPSKTLSFSLEKETELVHHSRQFAVLKKISNG